MARTITISLAVFLLFSFVFGFDVSAAAKKKSSRSITNIAKVGPAFHYAGEFVGSTTAANGTIESVGLQVIALGKNQFEAVLLRGGLPGEGWNRSTEVKLSGKLHRQQVQLISKSLVVSLSHQQAMVRNQQGNILARLQKIGRSSPTLGTPSPPEAIVLFGGSTDQLEDAKISPEGYLMAGSSTKMNVADFHMHLEFRTPYMPDARGQARGNSGVYIQRRYEVQILDSFGLRGEHNQCGGLYKQRRPDVNMCLPPLSWQTYDIDFTAPRWSRDGNTKIANARITVRHNGQLIHDDVQLDAKTGGGRPEGPQPLPILFQFHGNAVQYQNIWIVPRHSSTQYVQIHQGHCSSALP